MNLSRRVILITGASGGIGSAVARACAKQHATVVVHYFQNQTTACTLVDDITRQGGQAMAVGADLTHQEDVDRMVDEVHQKFERVDMLVNNAAPSHRFDPTVCPTLDRVPWDDFQQHLDGTLKSNYMCCRAVLPGMRAHQFGRIISILTNLIFMPDVVYHAYTTAKSSLLGFSRTLAREVGPSGITVNMIAPGLIKGTGLSAHHTKETLSSVAERTPLRRVGTPEDIAEAVLFFMSAAFVTGACLVVDGGLTMR